MNQHDQAYVHGFTTKLAQHGVSPAAFVRAAYASGNPGLVKVAGAISRTLFDEAGNLSETGALLAASPVYPIGAGAALNAAINSPANSANQNIMIGGAAAAGGIPGYVVGSLAGHGMGSGFANRKHRAIAELLGGVTGSVLGGGAGAYAANSYVNDNHGLVGKMRNRVGI